MKFDYPEGATPIDDDELSELIPTQISLQSELNEWEQANIIEALSSFEIRNYKFEDILDFHFILDVHKRMFNKTWKWSGKTRKTMKNIGVYVEQIFEENNI